MKFNCKSHLYSKIVGKSGEKAGVLTSFLSIIFVSILFQVNNFKYAKH